MAQAQANSDLDTTDKLSESVRQGYGLVWSGAKNAGTGLWLYLSRGILAYIWLYVALFVYGFVSVFSPSLAVIAGLGTFLAIPVCWGALKIKYGATTE